MSGFNRNPDLQPAIAGAAVELRAVALEIRGVRRLVPRLRQPLLPDAAHRAPERRDIVAMGEDRVALRFQLELREILRQPGGVADLDTADVVEIAFAIAIVT